MLLFEVICMGNPNALIALAYIKESASPFVTFCNYILYCLEMSPNKTLLHNELAKRVAEEFGLKLSPHMTRTCENILVKDGKIHQPAKSNRHFTINRSDFDVEKFNFERAELSKKEDLIISGLVTHMEKNGVTWTRDEARRHLTEFLVDGQNAARLFVDGAVETQTASDGITPGWWVADYVCEVMEQSSVHAEYLNEVVRGLMIYVGAYQIRGSGSELSVNQHKLKGTDFFLDTKLLLRAMGYSWKFEVDAANELIKLIKDMYGGNICAFQHTIDEIESALHNTAECLRRGDIILNLEMRMFAAIEKFTADDFDLRKDNVHIALHELGVTVAPNEDWTDPDTRKHNLDHESLYKYIRREYPEWTSEQGIKNDVNAIVSTNIRRKGNYTLRYGGQQKLPVFITTNSTLIDAMRSYIETHGQEDVSAADWELRALPVVSDYMIMTRLWLPHADRLTAIPALTLARNAYAAQVPGLDFHKKLKDVIHETQRKHPNYNAYNLPETYARAYERKLTKNIQGDVTKITEDVVVSTFEELVALQAAEKNEQIEKLNEKDSANMLTIKRQQQTIIQSAAKRYRNRVGYKRLVIQFFSQIWIISAVVVGIIGLIPMFIMDSLPSGYVWGVAVIAVILSSIKFIEKTLDRLILSDRPLSWAVFSAWKSYSIKVTSSLENEEKNLTREILNLCLTETPLFMKYQKYIPSLREAEQ